MPIHDVFTFSLTLATAITTFLVMQYLGHAVVRYFNNETDSARTPKGALKPRLWPMHQDQRC